MTSATLLPGPEFDEKLTAELARLVMGWTVAPDRFLMKNRRWTPKWRFQPLNDLNDAFQLLEAAAPEGYAMGGAGPEEFWAKVRIAGVTGAARSSSKPRAITLAVARAIGVPVDGR